MGLPPVGRPMLAVSPGWRNRVAVYIRASSARLGRPTWSLFMATPFSRHFLRLRAAFILVMTVAITACAMLVCQAFTRSPLELFLLTFAVSAPITAGFAYLMTLPIRRILFSVSEG